MAVRGLSTAELEQIRDALTAGRRPKVVFTESAGQIVGQHGQVVELADPAVSDEWVVVRFGRDELPFSPADLAIAPKGAPPRRQPKAGPADAPAEPPGPPLLPPDPPAATRTAVPAPREESPVSDVPTPDEAASGNGGQPTRPAKAPARKAARVKPPATLTVTLSYADGEWMVAAQQGSKSLAKPYVIKATEALKMVGMLDVPGVHEAVEEIVSAARAEAEAEAERLRSELAEIEARLAELRDAH
ncbi:DUF6319 family protein [Planosporangium mesophilum]|uniref:Translation initiation factor n=1 Tax=Planosporangium mesophilum TaxID=689768 RepID=A0A8J3TBE4_9ACTN|nr:DUF6319 family protein [Planosporangium mesophilum]NJC83007.1 hypothetical protein [Planosporangium mesophilum]GII22411.1 hypothetical protein Pme01_20080 [Planosporangium mesophilum]